MSLKLSGIKQMLKGGNMNLKITGILMILSSGVLCSFYVKQHYNVRIELLEEFIKNLDFMYGQIAFYKMPVYEIIEKLYELSQNKLKKFYSNVLKYVDSEGVESSIKKSINEIEAGFNKKDKIIICDFSKTLGETDYNTQLENIKICKGLLQNELIGAKENKNKNQKARCTLVMSSFIVLAMLIS